MIGIIELEDMEFYAHHGCYDLEKVVGGRFNVNLRIEADVTDAAKSDDVNKSVNYLSVYQMVELQMQVTCNILEHVASGILDRLYSEFPAVTKATVKISKLSPPLGGKVDKVSVTLTR